MSPAGLSLPRVIFAVLVSDPSLHPQILGAEELAGLAVLGSYGSQQRGHQGPHGTAQEKTPVHVHLLALHTPVCFCAQKTPWDTSLPTGLGQDLAQSLSARCLFDAA